MDLEAFRARIEDQVPALADVLGSASYVAAAVTKPTRTPCAYVVPLADAAGENQLVNAVSQRLTEQFGVIFVLKNVTDQRGDKVNADLAVLRDAVRAALLGWAPTGEHEPTVRGQGRLLDFKDQLLWWQDTYLTARNIRSV
jgi:hypothetical protein